MSTNAVSFICPTHFCDMKASGVKGYWLCPEGCLWDACGDELEPIVAPKPVQP